VSDPDAPLATFPPSQLFAEHVGGALLGVAPKSYLPTYREFYERRQMAAGDCVSDVIRLSRDPTRAQPPFGPDLLFHAADMPGLVLHVEICEDMWIPIPPSAHAALAGVTVLTNLSGSPVTIGRAEDRCLLARSASLRCVAAHIYAAAGDGESTTDLAWDGQTMIWQNGVCLAQSPRFPTRPKHCVADIDLELLCSIRRRFGIFDANRNHHHPSRTGFRRVEFLLNAPRQRSSR
jgi:NAD+ synthase (glutamine-hydrolysing)